MEVVAVTIDGENLVELVVVGRLFEDLLALVPRVITS